MSASQDKVKRQEERDTRIEKKRQEREEAEKASKKFKTKVTVIVVAFLVVAAAVLLLSSDMFYRNFTAVQVDNTKWSIADYNFNYSNQFTLIRNELQSALGDSAVSDSIPQYSSELKDYVYNEETGETWDDYISELTVKTLKEISLLCEKAEAAGHTLTDAETLSMNNEINTVALYANYNSVDVNTYTEVQYGKGVNYDVYKKNIEKLYIADSYAKVMEAGYEYTDAELDDYYAEKADTYDYVTYRSYYVSGQATDGGDAEAAMAEARATADEFAGKVTDEASFISLCLEYSGNNETYLSEDASLTTSMGGSIATSLKDWLLDGSRKAGDVTVSESTYGYYVGYFISRDVNDYNTVNAEYFVLAPQTVDETAYETTEEYQQAVEDRAAEVRTTVQKMKDDWTGGADFATVKSDYASYIYQSGQADDNGRSSFPTEVTDWLFDTARKDGDIEMVETSDGQFFLVRYAGQSDLYNRVIARSAMSSADYKAWAEEASAACSYKSTWVMAFAK